MIKRLFLFSCAVLAFAQDYKLEPITGAPADLPGAYASLIDSKGYRVVGPKGPWCEVWFRKSIPTSGKPADGAIAFPIVQGTLLGVIRFPSKATDRRDQDLKPSVYSVRYSTYKVDGAHQGISPQRDFALLTPVANDPDPNATPDWDRLVEWSKTSGTAHPAVLSIEPPAGTSFPALTKGGEHDWSLAVKIGDLPLALLVVGKYEG